MSRGRTTSAAHTLSVMAQCSYARDGGLVTTSQLASGGWSRHRIATAVTDARLTRVRKGLYRCHHASPRVTQAARMGGRLTGLAALAEHGCWMWREPRLTVALPRNAPPPPHMLACKLRWVTLAEVGRASLAALALPDALRHVALDEELEDAVAAFDWAFTSGNLSHRQFHQVLTRLPARLSRLRFLVDPQCESFLESIARTRLLLGGHRVESQVAIGPSWLLRRRQRVDLVVNGRVALELDGREHHEAAFETDRRKDLDIAVAGLIPLRASYAMVEREWWLIEQAIERGSSAPAQRRTGDVAAPSRVGVSPTES